MSLLGLNQGNIWLFDDSVLITGKSSGTVNVVSLSHSSLLIFLVYNNSFNLSKHIILSNCSCTTGKNTHIFSCCFFPPLFVDTSSLPVVQFPKSLLNLTDSSNFTSVKAFLTFPKLPSERDSFQNTFGILTSKSGRCVLQNPFFCCLFFTLSLFKFGNGLITFFYSQKI